MIRALKITVVFFLFWACQKKESTNDVLNTVNDTIVIENKCVVFYGPTEKQIEELKSEFTEEDPRRETIDDILYYRSESKVFMEEQNIKIRTVESNKVLKFIISDEKRTIVQKEKNKEIGKMWKIYLFEPGKEPVELEDITAPETEYKQYFKD